MDTVDHTTQVHIEYLTPVFNAVTPGPIHRVTADSRVVAKDVDTTKSAVGAIGQRLHRPVSRHVRRRSEDAHANSLELAR